MRILLLPAMACLLLLLTNTTFAATAANHPPHVDRYIESYHEIAIREMHRSGIPASVIIAQGIHESSWGLGELSTNSNNHFGIKCKAHWTGPTYYIEDDDYENGELMKSCFRVYNSVEESYIDHTNFLVERPRYKTLFNFHKTDYKNWSKGLEDCGYATDTEYSEKLIRTIEKYDLAQYDEANRPIVSAPDFHFPAPNEPMPQMAIPNVETTSELMISSTVNQVINSTTANASQEEAKENIPTEVVEEEIPPAAVNIENYNQNDYKIINEAVEEEAISTTTFEEEVFMEDEEFMQEEEEVFYDNNKEEVPTPYEKIESQAIEEIPSATILPPPAFQVTVQVEKERMQSDAPTNEQELSVTKMTDNHLQVMSGKMRVARKPRQ